MEAIFGLGVLVSLALHELLNLSPGGIIVPGYLALYLAQPRRIAATLVVAVLARLGVMVLSEVVILYGRRKLACHVLLGLTLSWLLSRCRLANLGPWHSLGYVIPGLIAGDMDRQGILVTAAASVFAASLVLALSQVIAG